MSCYTTGAGGVGAGIGTGTAQCGPMDAQGGQQLTDLMARCRGHHHHHHHGEGEGGGMPGGPMGGQDPCDPVDGQDNPGSEYGSPFPIGMGGQDPCGHNPYGQDPRISPPFIGIGIGGQDPCGQDPCGQDPCNPMGGQYGSPFPIGMNGNSGYNCGCGGGMSVDTANNSITIGDTKITASADGNTITATDVCTGKTLFTSTGDPHLTAGDGSKADYQQSSISINLPGGGICHIDPGPVSNGVAVAKDCIVTDGNQAAKITFGPNGVQTTNLGEQGYALDRSTPAGVELNSNPDGSLTLLNGSKISGNIDGDATAGPMGRFANFGGFGAGAGMPTNDSAAIAQLDNIISYADQEIAQLEQQQAMTNVMRYA